MTQQWKPTQGVARFLSPAAKELPHCRGGDHFTCSECIRGERAIGTGGPSSQPWDPSPWDPPPGLSRHSSFLWICEAGAESAKRVRKGLRKGDQTDLNRSKQQSMIRMKSGKHRLTSSVWRLYARRSQIASSHWRPKRQQTTSWIIPYSIIFQTSAKEPISQDLPYSYDQCVYNIMHILYPHIHISISTHFFLRTYLPYIIC